PEQGVEIARQRTAALNRYQREPGGMLTIATTRVVAECLVELAGADRTSVAADNGPDEIVISGTASGLDVMHALASDRHIAIAPLKARWAFQCADVMRPAAVALKEALRSLSWQPLRLPVFSPILGRYYTWSDNLVECLANHLVDPVGFAHAVRFLASAGVER